MAILEKGLSPDFFKDTTNYIPFILMLGIVSIGISLGIAVSAFLWSLHLEEVQEFIFPFSIFLFLGISLVVSYFVLKATQKRS